MPDRPLDLHFSNRDSKFIASERHQYSVLVGEKISSFEFVKRCVGIDLNTLAHPDTEVAYLYGSGGERKEIEELPRYSTTPLYRQSGHWLSGLINERIWTSLSQRVVQSQSRSPEHYALRCVKFVQPLLNKSRNTGLEVKRKGQDARVIRFTPLSHDPGTYFEQF